MRFNIQMDTQQLHAFLAIAETESFSKAAEQLHLTQPAVSKRIACLEESLGCKLLDRIGRSTRLTEAGQALLPRAKKILYEFSDTHNALSKLSGSVQGTLKLATSHHIGLHHLPVILRHYTEQYPQVNLELVFLDSDKAYEAIQHGDAELAIITLAQHKPLAITHLPLWQDKLCFVSAADHPLASNKHLLLQDLGKYPAILPDAETTTTKLIKSLMDSANIGLTLAMPTNYLETIKMMVSIGLGWSALPKTMLADKQLKTLEIPNIELIRTLGCIHHKDRSLSNAADALLYHLQNSSSDTVK
jgi:DNA-binding transcriptional LysR family regulator